MNALQSSSVLLGAVLSTVTAACFGPVRMHAPSQAAFELAEVPPPKPTLLWTTPLVGWGRPSVRDDSVYSLTRAHEMVSLDKLTGAVRWRRPLPLANGAYSGFPM